MSNSNFQNRGRNDWGWNKNKRPYNSDWKQAQQQQYNKLNVGMCGLFFTAEDEKRAVREARNLIEHFLSETNEESKPSSGNDEDIADSLTKTCNELQKQGSDRNVALRQIETGSRCTLFFISPMITPENVYILAEKMVELCQEKPQNRFLAKVIPIEETVPAYMDQILPALSKMITKHLGQYADSSTPPTYAIDFKARNTKLIEKQKVYDDVTELMKELVPGCSVNLTQPKMLIVVHAIRATALLGILRDFDKLQKYALRKPTAEEQKSETVKGEDEAKEEIAKEEKEGDD